MFFITVSEIFMNKTLVVKEKAILVYDSFTQNRSETFKHLWILQSLQDMGLSHPQLSPVSHDNIVKQNLDKEQAKKDSFVYKQTNN